MAEEDVQKAIVGDGVVDRDLMWGAAAHRAHACDERVLPSDDILTDDSPGHVVGHEAR
jgi:hypothetical protein